MLTSWYQVKHADYTNTGFDRGHLCPSDDRDSTAEENKTTFILTNIVPQAPQLNRQPWLRLEDYCQNLVAKEMSCTLLPIQRAKVVKEIVMLPVDSSGSVEDGIDCQWQTNK